MSTPDYIYPIIVPSDSNVKDTFSSINTPDYTPASPDYSPASPGNTSSDPLKDLSKDLLASLSISPFQDDPYIKVMQAYNATSNESPIPPPRAPIAVPTILPPSPVCDEIIGSWFLDEIGFAEEGEKIKNIGIVKKEEIQRWILDIYNSGIVEKERCRDGHHVMGGMCVCVGWLQHVIK
ncbi:hypothetical protein Tco_0575690 [Tanacetum coccineum]